MKNLIFYMNILCFIYTQTFPYICKQEDRQKACSQEYKGVCGLFNQSIQCIKAPCGQTFGTICQACSEERIASVTDGICGVTNTNNNSIGYCSSQSRGLMCTQEYVGVCAWYDSSVNCVEKPCTKTMGNFCSACTDSKVEKVTNGECPKEMKELKQLSETNLRVNFIFLIILILF